MAFGSAKEGEIRPGGDLDLSVLFDKPPSLNERAELLIQLQRA
ncbi:MAG: nucleotidyltransferase domain-containing protein [Anaerolineales bacterium]